MLTEPAAAESFELLEFWYVHKTKIVLYAAILVIVLGGYGGFALVRQVRAARAESLFAAASSMAEMQAVATRYPGTVAGGNAALEWAASLRKAGQYDAAAKVLLDFRIQFPEHPLMGGAWVTLASVYEFQGKLDLALDTYKQAASKFQNDYIVPIAMMAQARIYTAQGKKEEAKGVYQDVVQRYQGASFYAQQAAQEQQLSGR